MKKLCTILFLVFLLVINTKAQKLPKGGTYFLDFIDMEYQGKKYGTCKAVVKGNRIKLYVVKGCYQKPGMLIEEGILLIHKSGKIIIGGKKTDRNATEIGGCSDGPRIIDFKKKRYETC
ncbi:MAG: hypothetical protein KA319_02375 [Ferruginibacter sp.]|nr:hypothetical protein [Ferruginibacter sp.]